MSQEVAIAILLVGLVVVGAVVVLALKNSRSSSEALRRRFGPEYERALAEYGDPKAAERALLARAKRVRKLHIGELGRADRQQFTMAWQEAQARFVDDPATAVRHANDLIKRVMRARGYPVEDFDQRVADLSVDHAEVVQHYRAARALALANQEGRANTEELRQAMVHYRALFAELLGETQSKSAQFQEVRA